MNRSTFWMIKYMNGSVFSKARHMNGVGFEILARTPVPKLPLSYPPPPRPPEVFSRTTSACYTESLHCLKMGYHGKGAREQHYFSVRPTVLASVHLSITLFSHKLLGGIQPNLLHHFRSW